MTKSIQEKATYAADMTAKFFEQVAQIQADVAKEQDWEEIDRDDELDDVVYTIEVDDDARELGAIFADDEELESFGISSGISNAEDDEEGEE